MSTPQRLPIVNADDGTWGDILRQYLMLQHYDDGTDNPGINGGHQNITIRPGTTSAAPLTFASGTNLTTPAAGSMEFTTDTLYFTITTGTTRKAIALFDDSSGASGDLHYRTSTSGNLQRLGIGTAGQTLQVSSGAPAWGYTNAGFNIGSHGGTYTVTNTDTVVLADASSGNVTITLPLASGLGGYRFYIKRIDSTTSNSVTIARTTSDLIDGLTSQSLPLQYQSVAVVSDGSTNWYIL